MKKINLNTESYLFDGENGKFRAIPFFELSIDEWVIYQNQEPKYLLNFNYRESSFVKQVSESMEQGVDLEEIINKYGIYLGLYWTTKHYITSKEIPDSQKPEKVELELIESFGDIANELIFIATDSYKQSDLINEDELLEKYMIEDESGFYSLESMVVDRKENIEKLLEFLFQIKTELTTIQLSENISIYDLGSLIGKSINLNQLESDYQKWIEISGRNNTMDEYGTLLGLISFLERSLEKKQLILRIEKKILCPTMCKKP
ncbi:hypothetical protein [Cellulophaga baltica]|uniref:hypothetical protein n=1 Tax=Cellulophaga baltica TaxID=76594 RepID=UPI00249427EF|nr:hypothetical protein [Cellulophaga baltica]